MKNSDEKHSVQSRSLLIARSEDIADMDKNPSKYCLSLSTGMKPSGGCFRVPVRWEDTADRNAFLPKFRLSFSTGALKHPPDGFIRVLRDRELLDGFLSIFLSQASETAQNVSHRSS